MQFHRRFGKGKIGRPELELPCPGDLLAEELQQSEQRPEIDVLSQHDTLDLVKVRRMGRVHGIVAEAPGNGEVFARHLWPRTEGPGRHGRALAAQDQPFGPLDVEVIAPAGRAGPAAVLVRRGDLLSVGLLDLPAMRGVLHKIDVMNVAGRVELRHEQRVHVPEFVLHQGAAHLLKAHADELILHEIEELPVGMLPADADAGRAERDIVGAELLLLP